VGVGPDFPHWLHFQYTEFSLSERDLLFFGSFNTEDAQFASICVKAYMHRAVASDWRWCGLTALRS